MGDRKSGLVYALIIVAIGLGLRLLWISVQGLSHTGDLLYERLAVNLLQCHGFTTMDRLPFTPTAVRPPLYPAWIAFIYLLFGQNLMAVFYSQALIGAFTSLVVYWIGKEIHSGKLGLLAAFLFTIHPYPQLFVTCLFVETLYSFLLACAVLFLCRGWKKESAYNNWIFAGVGMGLAALTRSEIFVFPLLLVFLMRVIPSIRKRLMTGGLLFLLSATLTLLPWTIRNYIHFKKLIPISDSFYGIMFMVTTLDKNEYDQKQHPSAFQAQPPTYASSYPMVVKTFEIFSDPKNYNRTNEIALYDQQALPIGIEKVKKAPLKYLVNRVKELPYLWIESGNYLLHFIDERIPNTSWRTLLKKPNLWILFWKSFGLLVTSILPLGLALWGIGSYRKRWRDFIPLFLIPLLITLMHIPFWIEVRYSVPSYPIIFVFTAMGILAIQSSVASRKS